MLMRLEEGQGSFPVNSSLPRCSKRSWGGRCCRGKGQRSPQPPPHPCEAGSGDSAAVPFPLAVAGHRLPHLQLISPSPAGRDRRGALGEKPPEMDVVRRALRARPPMALLPTASETRSHSEFGLKGTLKCQPGQSPQPRSAPTIPRTMLWMCQPRCGCHRATLPA